jgi:hypothetical protein
MKTKSESNSKSAQTPGIENSKKNYHAPQLKVYGSLNDLTSASKGGHRQDGLSSRPWTKADI